MAHRLREAMRDGNPSPMGGEGKVVEADETYFGNVKAAEHVDVFVSGKGWVKRDGGLGQKMKVVSLVERGGNVRSVKVDHITANTVREIVTANVKRETALMTDESNVYTKVGKEFASHDTVNHGAKEYGRGPVYTNTIEGVFSIFKRGMKGVYQHCREKHLHRYLAEFDFRYNNRSALGVEDQERTGNALRGVAGKRLTYRGSNSNFAAETTA
jgi:transposase-like protein